MKHLLIAVYLFSILYCYLQINIMIDKCVEEFKKKHPGVLSKTRSSWSEFKLHVELLAISSIPVVNLIVGFLMSNFDNSVISEVVSNVELKHWKEIKEMENRKL